MSFKIPSNIERKVTLLLRRRRRKALLDHPAIKAQFSDGYARAAKHDAVRRTGRHALQTVCTDVALVGLTFARVAALRLVSLPEKKLAKLEKVAGDYRKALRAEYMQIRARRHRRNTLPSNREKKVALMEVASSCGWRGRSYRKALQFEQAIDRNQIILSGPQRGTRRARHQAPSRVV